MSERAISEGSSCQILNIQVEEDRVEEDKNVVVGSENSEEGASVQRRGPNPIKN